MYQLSEPHELYDPLESARWHLVVAEGCIQPEHREARLGAKDEVAQERRARVDRRVRGCASAARSIQSSLRTIGVVVGLDRATLSAGNVRAMSEALEAHTTGATRDMLSTWMFALPSPDFWVDIDETQARRMHVPPIESCATQAYHALLTAAAAEAADCAQDEVAHALGERASINDEIAGVAADVRSLLPLHMVGMMVWESENVGVSLSM